MMNLTEEKRNYYNELAHKKNIDMTDEEFSDWKRYCQEKGKPTPDRNYPHRALHEFGRGRFGRFKNTNKKN